MKTCNKCGLEKELTEFSICRTSARGSEWLRGVCKVCLAAKGRAWRAANGDQARSNKRAWMSSNPEQVMLNSARQRAKRVGVPFNIDLGDINIPQLCPVLGIPLHRNSGNGPSANSPSLDRIIPSLGYVKGNVAVISNRANIIKQDANPEEILAVYNWLASVLPKTA